MPETITAKRPIHIKETVDGITVDELTYGATEDSKIAEAATRKRKAATAAVDEKPKSDPYIWGIYFSLLAFSLVELFSASSFEVTSSNVYAPLIRHALFLLVGLGIVVWFQRMRYVVFRKWARLFAFGSFLLLLIVTFGGGVSINGAERALRFAGITVQPAEIVKLAIVVVLAQILATNQIPRGVSNRGIVISAIVVIAFAALTWKNGLTNTLLVMGVSLAMFLIGGMGLKKFFIVVAIYCLAAGVVYTAKSADDDTSFKNQAEQTEQTEQGLGRAETHSNRIDRFLKGVSPDDPINDMNRQVIMSKFALAHGGIIGQGPGNSRESARLPLAFSDYIYSIVIEDTGLVGGIVLLLLYLCLIGRAGYVAGKCSRAFPALLIMGSAVLIVLQALVHMAIVVGIVPVSGQPLPFISKGGTSILIMSAAIGMMLSVSRYGMTSGNKKRMRAELKELPVDLQAENPTFIGSAEN